MLTTKRRFLIVLLVILGAVIAVGAIVITRIANTSINEIDPLYFKSPYKSTFYYNNGTDTFYINFETYQIADNYTTCRITAGSMVYYYNYTFDGFYIDPITGKTNNQSVFWLHIVRGLGSETVQLVGSSYYIYDQLGILGAANGSYIATITGNIVYWPTEAPLHGAQASFIITITDLSGKIVASGEIDLTCGIVFKLTIGSNAYRVLQLIDTNYVISRNRISAFWPLIISAIVTPIAAFIYIYYFKKNYSKEDLIDTVFIIAFGEVSLIVDFYIDIWMYAIFGFSGNMIIHLMIIVVGAVFSVIRRYKLKWLIPSILEVLFVSCMVMFVGESYVPHMTAFMGITISWLILLWLSGYNRQKSKSLKGRIMSNLV